MCPLKSKGNGSSINVCKVTSYLTYVTTALNSSGFMSDTDVKTAELESVKQRSIIISFYDVPALRAWSAYPKDTHFITHAHTPKQ